MHSFVGLNLVYQAYRHCNKGRERGKEGITAINPASSILCCLPARASISFLLQKHCAFLNDDIDCETSRQHFRSWSCNSISSSLAVSRTQQMTARGRCVLAYGALISANAHLSVSANLQSGEARSIQLRQASSDLYGRSTVMKT